MKITELIQQRKSIRSYTGSPLDPGMIRQINEYAGNLPQPLGGKARVAIMGRQDGNEPVKLGTYGIISGTHHFLVLIYEESPLAAANAGYFFEQVVLQCTALGLGTCWLGGTFKKADFTGHISLGPDEVMRIVSPVGYPAQKGKLLDRLMRAGAGSDKRKPFESLFFDGDFDTPLKKRTIYREPLEMTRLAPSASNSQPWRVLLDGNKVHFFYRKKSAFTDIDMGIALCHFEQTCKELGISGNYTRTDGIPETGDNRYLISWISE